MAHSRIVRMNPRNLGIEAVHMSFAGVWNLLSVLTLRSGTTPPLPLSCFFVKPFGLMHPRNECGLLHVLPEPISHAQGYSEPKNSALNPQSHITKHHGNS